MDDHEIARLLARREGASVLEKEATFERIMDELELQRREHAPWWSRVSSWVKPAGVAAVVVAGAWLAWVRAPEPDEWTARGTRQAEPELKLACVESSVGAAQVVPCVQGKTLTFDLSDTAHDRFFAAVARREDDALIWYQPTPNGVSIPATSGLLGQGIRLGSEHPPGRYRVIAVLSRRPLSRDAIRTVLERPEERGAEIELVERTLEITAP